MYPTAIRNPGPRKALKRGKVPPVGTVTGVPKADSWGRISAVRTLDRVITLIYSLCCILQAHDPISGAFMPASLPSKAVTSPNDEQMQRRGFARQRDRRNVMIAEDYCELIADLIVETGEARAVDIARRLGVSHATVVNAVARLRRGGYVLSEPYRAIFLTALGQKIAGESKRRHITVTRLLEALGVDAETARADAEGIEHHVSDATLAAFERFIATHP